MSVVQDDFTGRMRPSPADLEVRAASSTNPSIVLTKFKIWTYDLKHDEWKQLVNLPHGRNAVAVISTTPPTVVCLDGSVMKLEGEWKPRTPLPGSQADEERNQDRR